MLLTSGTAVVSIFVFFWQSAGDISDKQKMRQKNHQLKVLIPLNIYGIDSSNLLLQKDCTRVGRDQIVIFNKRLLEDWF